MARRIDTLYCDKETAPEKAKVVIEDINTNASIAKKGINDKCQAAIDALNDRRAELEKQVDDIVAAKLEELESQLSKIEEGTCPPAPAENPFDDPDPTRFVLCKDGVVLFKDKLDELKEAIAKFGRLDECSTYASESRARGPGVDEALKIGIQGFFDVYACDLWGDQRKEGGENLTVTLSVPGDFVMDVKDFENGKYRVNLLPSVVGTYKVTVIIGDEEMRGSPFVLEVLPVKDYSKIGLDHQDGNPWLSDEMGKLRRPAGLAYDPTGKYVLVSDQCNDRLMVFDATSKELKCQFGTKGRGPQEFNTPGYIACDRDNRVIVTDILNHRLQIFSFNPQTALLKQIRTLGGKGSGERQFHFPRGIRISEAGRLYVCDSGNNRVSVFDVLDNYKFIHQIGEEGEGEGQFRQPSDVALTRNSEILVADSGHRIQVFDEDGVFLRSYGGKGRKPGMFKHITSLTVDDENHVFVCDTANHRVQVLNASEGTFVHKWGGCPRKPPAEGEEGGEAEPVEGDDAVPALDQWIGLSTPHGITLNAYGKILVSDYNRHCVYDY